MNRSATRSALWLAIEDYAGLWELAWELRTQGHPEEAVQETARVVATELLERGWIDLYRCEEPYGELSKVDGSKAPELLLAPSTWREPSKDAVSIRMGATPEGEAVYASLAAQD